jgi:hypothetical protein
MGNEKLASLQQFGSGVSQDDGAFLDTNPPIGAQSDVNE